MDVTYLRTRTAVRCGRGRPFDFARDREPWRWIADDVSLRLTRTPFVPVEVSLGLARLISEHRTLRDAVRALSVSEPEVIAYACASGGFVGGVAGERAMCEAMTPAGEAGSLATSGALLEALTQLGAEKIALVTPYTASVTQSLEEYLSQAGTAVTGRAFLGLTRNIWKVPLRMPVISANQVTMWSALRRIGVRAVGPYQALLMDAPPEVVSPPPLDVAPPVQSEAVAGPSDEQEGWT